jgi:hypothetical protein
MKELGCHIPLQQDRGLNCIETDRERKTRQGYLTKEGRKASSKYTHHNSNSNHNNYQGNNNNYQGNNNNNNYQGNNNNYQGNSNNYQGNNNNNYQGNNNNNYKQVMLLSPTNQRTCSHSDDGEEGGLEEV